MSAVASRLHAYLDAWRDRPFAWGPHDCFHFAMGAASAQTGDVYDLPHYTSVRGAVEASREATLLQRVDQYFARCTHVPPPGSLVAVQEDGPIGYRLGVVVSDKAAFVSPNGLVFARLHPKTDIYWVVK